MIVKSHSTEGDAFLSGMWDIEKRWQYSRNLFNDFLRSLGCECWHIHDGHVKHNYENGDVLHHKEIQLNWIDGHAGFSHTYNKPVEGKSLIIIKDSPDIEDKRHKNPFNMYWYNVSKKSRFTRFTDQYDLELIEIKKAIYNPATKKYQLYIPTRWEKFKNKFHRFNNVI